MSEVSLIVKIENRRPVEIRDFTESFNSLGDEYYKFITESNDFRLSKNAKLYIKEIKTGSIVTELSDLIPLALPFIENANSVIEFGKFLKEGFDFFLGKKETPPKEFDLKDCNNFNNILKPVAKDNGSQIIFSGNPTINIENFNYGINSVEANAIQNGINLYKESLKEPERNIQEKVLFYWDSAKYAENSKAIDKGFVDSISTKALKVIFDDSSIKKQMFLDIESNPFHFAFVVDVEVMTINGTPNVYKVLKLHDTLEK